MYASFTGTFGTWCCDSEIGNVMMYNRKMASLYNRINQVCFQSFIGQRTKKFIRYCSLIFSGGIILAEQEKNRISVEIYGNTYKMVGTESSVHMRLVASLVDDKMREISAHNPSLDTAKLAVLTAVNSVHDYLLLKEQFEKLEIQLKHLKG